MFSGLKKQLATKKFKNEQGQPIRFRVNIHHPILRRRDGVDCLSDDDMKLCKTIESGEDFTKLPLYAYQSMLSKKLKKKEHVLTYKL